MLRLRLPLAAPAVAAALLLLAACSTNKSAAPPAKAPSAAAAAGAVITPAGRPTPAPRVEAVAPATGFPALGVPSGETYAIGANTFEALPGAKAVTGTLGGAAFRIEMPARWNGELVMFAHGYRGEGGLLTVSNPPQALRQAFIDGGYAWAASSYRENGYAPGIAADDTLALKRYFAQQYGIPKRTYIAGVSMGGNVVALSLEHFKGEYDGALSMCGALGGQEEIDYLAAWAMAAEYTSGIHLGVGENGGAGLTMNTLLQLSGSLGTPTSPTARGQQFISIIRLLTGGPRPFFLEGLDDQYVTNFAFLLLDPARKLAVTQAATNDGVTYAVEDGLGLTSAEVNAAIRRLAPVASVRDAAAYPDHVPTSGKITAPLLTLHDTGDLFVPISQEVAYLGKVKAAGAGGLLVQRAIRDAGHCQFSDSEELAAWHDLVSWVEGGPKPAGDDLSAPLADIGRQFTNPLRAGDPGSK